MSDPGPHGSDGPPGPGRRHAAHDAQARRAERDSPQRDTGGAHDAHGAHNADGAHGTDGRHHPESRHGSPHAPHPHGDSGHAASGGHSGRGPVTWASAVQATLHCLTGCAIGEVLGMVIGTVLGLADLVTVVLSVALAFVFGYALTMTGVMRAGVGFKAALGVALAADTVSIAIMEFLDNAVMVGVPGAMDAGLTSVLFWGSLAFSLLVAFVFTTPVNRWMIARGKGHAVVHRFHHHDH